MADTYKCMVKGFAYPYFIAAMMHQTDPKSLTISQRKGITTKSFVDACFQKFETFQQTNTYSKESIEQFFGVEFCNIRVEKKQILCFEEKPLVGGNVIYIHKRLYKINKNIFLMKYFQG